MSTAEQRFYAKVPGCHLSKRPEQALDAGIALEMGQLWLTDDGHHSVANTDIRSVPRFPRVRKESRLRKCHLVVLTGSTPSQDFTGPMGRGKMKEFCLPHR